MNKRQKKKLELKFYTIKNMAEIFNLRQNLNNTNDVVKELTGSTVHMQLENNERIRKIEEENSILIEEQEKQGKRITGVYIMILVVILLEVVQWWILHA